MNVAIETVNQWGEWFMSFSLGMLLQSSVLIVILASLDWLLRNRARAIVRYSLWMLLLLKLVLPVNLSLPTSVIEVSPILAYNPPEYAAPAQLLASVASPAPAAPLVDRQIPKSEASDAPTPVSSSSAPLRIEPDAALSPFGWALLGCLLTIALLFVAVVWKSIRVSRFVRCCAPAPRELAQILGSCLEQLRIRRHVDLRVSDENVSPALCGIIRPCILLPRSLAATLEANQLRAVLLHELVHLKRGDLLVNLAQTILQIVYFYHPLLWLANSRIRKLREQAVDEAVLVAMGSEAEMYPATLVNVAKFTLDGRAISFGMVGVMESRSAFSSRIRRMLARPFPTSARLGVTSIVAMMGIAVCVLPMAGRETAKENADGPDVSPTTATQNSTSPSKSTEPLVSTARAKSLEQLFAEYEVFGEHRKRSQAAIHAELTSRGNFVEFLSQKLRKDASKPDTADRIQARRKAAHLAGKLGRRGEALISSLLDCLEDEDEIRHAATQALGNIGPAATAAIPMLSEELQFQNIYAGVALANVAPHSEAVLNSLIEAALDSSKEPIFRHQTVEAFHFVRIRNEVLTNALQKLSKEPDGDIKDAALRLLGKLDKPRYFVSADSGRGSSTNSLPELTDRLRNNPDDFEAAQGLRQLGTNSTDALPILVELLEKRKGRFPANFASAIGQMGSAASNAVPVLIGCLAEDDRALFINSVNALGRIGSAAGTATPKLIGLLDDPDADIRWHAANALRKIDPAGINRYVPVLLQPFSNGTAQAHHASILRELGEHGRAITPKLREMLDGQEHVRLSAAEALLELEPSSGPDLVPMLIRTLQDHATMNHHWAARLLGKIGEPARSALPLLNGLTSSENALFANAAREAINRIEQKAP